MNAPPRFDPPAELRYGTPEFQVIKPGTYVLCAVSGRRIPLDALLYWSVERQEAYAGPEEAMARMRAGV
jgi:hypothetical protein